jgi:DNA-binding SARP family transcriptional activator
VVALGGDDVESATVMAALWPDADGAAAKTSFDTALFRLRKLLDVDGALRLTGGKLSLAPELVWTDVAAFQDRLDAAQRIVEAKADGAAIARSARALLDAYPGPLLGGDDAPWVAKPRDALRARTLRILLALGEALEASGAWDVAADVYRRGLEADNLAEPFYRGLMRALAASGDQAEALVAFRRCRELLSVVLGLKPAAETERLARDIASGAPATAAPRAVT